MHNWILETERLRLRELEPADLDFVAAMLADPVVMRFYPKPLIREEASQWLERQRIRYRVDGHGLWLVVRRDGGEPVGQVGVLRQIVAGTPELEVGYLLDRPFWRRGFATEAATAARDHALSGLRAGKVIALIRPENEPSQAVAGRLGMSIHGQTEWGGLLHDIWGTPGGAG